MRVRRGTFASVLKATPVEEKRRFPVGEVVLPCSYVAAASLEYPYLARSPRHRARYPFMGSGVLYEGRVTPRARFPLIYIAAVIREPASAFSFGRCNGVSLRNPTASNREGKKV